MMQRILVSGAMVCMALVLVGLSPHVAVADGPQLVITSVEVDVDADAGRLTLHGNFASKKPVVVTLDGAALEVSSSSLTEIVVTLPGDVAPGTHRLEVRKSTGKDDDDDGETVQLFSAMDVTIGVAGPKGDTGPAGPTSGGNVVYFIPTGEQTTFTWTVPTDTSVFVEVWGAGGSGGGGGGGGDSGGGGGGFGGSGGSVGGLSGGGFCCYPGSNGLVRITW